jgi:hypothetical protein
VTLRGNQPVFSQENGRQDRDSTAQTRLSDDMALADTARKVPGVRLNLYGDVSADHVCVWVMELVLHIGKFSSADDTQVLALFNTRGSLPRRAGYRRMRLNVVTGFGGHWASGAQVGRGDMRPDGPSRESQAGQQAERPLWQCRPPSRGQATSDGKENV